MFWVALINLGLTWFCKGKEITVNHFCIFHPVCFGNERLLISNCSPAEQFSLNNSQFYAFQLKLKQQN